MCGVVVEAARAGAVRIPHVDADVLILNHPAIGQHARGDDRVVVRFEIVTGRQRDAVVRRADDGVVVRLHICRITARRRSNPVPEHDAAAGEAPVVRVRAVGGVALPGRDRVRAVDQVVVDQDRAGGGSAGIVDADVVFNAAFARQIDDLVPRDLHARHALHFVELHELHQLHAVFGLAGRLVRARVVGQPAAVAVALAAVNVLGAVVDDLDRVRRRVISRVAEQIDAGGVFKVAVFDNDVVEVLDVHESPRRLCRRRWGSAHSL